MHGVNLMKRAVIVLSLLALILVGCTKNEETDRETETISAAREENDTLEPMQFPDVELPDDVF